MANTLGRLLVLLGLDSSEYTRGLTKAEYQAQQFARNTRSAILEVGKVLGGLELGRQFYEATKEIINQAAALNDLADVAGSSVEEVSRLANQAAIAGTDFNTLQGYVSKLATEMAKGDDATRDASRALAQLGITTKDPVQAFQQVAVALSGYEDGIGKVAIATALFGKQGASVLPVLKDIAELQDVGATTTKKQADEAENLQKAWARLTVEATAFKNVILGDVVPGLNAMIAEFRTSIEVAGGLFTAFRLFSGLDLSNPQQQIERLTGVLKELEAQRTDGGFLSSINNAQVDRQIADTKKQIEFLRAMQRQRAEALIDPSNNDARDMLAQRRPAIAFSLTDDKKAKAGGGAAKTSEAERYLESLRKQLEGTLDLTEAEKVLREVQAGRLKDASQGQVNAALAIAQEIDANREAAEWVKENAKAHDEAAKAVQRDIDARARANDALMNESLQIRDANEQLRDEIAIIVGGEAAREALEQQYVANAIAIKEEALAMAQLDPLRQDEAANLRVQIDLLRERADLLGGRGIAKQMAEEARAVQDVKNMFSDTFADAFADVVTGAKSAKDAFTDFANSILRNISRIAAQNIANAIFGGNNSAGPDIFGVLAKIGGSIFGGGGYSGGFSGGGFGEHFALGGVSSGGLAMVGENGPELVNLPRGARVYSNPETRQMLGGQNVTLNFSVQGPVNRATEYQIAQAAQRGLARAGRR